MYQKNEKVEIMIEILFKRHCSSAITPSKATTGSAGYDLHACIEQPIVLSPQKITLIPLGFSIALPCDHEAEIRPRSGLASKHGVTLPNTPGTIDSDYRGEIKIPLINLIKKSFTIEPQMRIAQMLIKKIPTAKFIEVDNLEQTKRGSNGFGSTGY